MKADEIYAYSLTVHPRDFEPYFSQWMSAMTSCKIHDKADFARLIAMMHKMLETDTQSALREALMAASTITNNVMQTIEATHAVMAYATHKPDCPTRYGHDFQCDCGLHEALARLANAYETNRSITVDITKG